MKIWVVFYTSCEECGPEQAVAVFDHKPSQEEISNIGSGDSDYEFNFIRATCGKHSVIEVAEFNSLVRNKD